MDSAAIRREYRGWRFTVHRSSRFTWDVDHTPPGNRLASDFLVSPFRAMTSKRSEEKFRRYVDSDIAFRVAGARRYVTLHEKPAPPWFLIAPEEGEALV